MKTLTDEEKRVKLAEALGWRFEKWNQGGWQVYNPQGERVSDLSSGSKEYAAESNLPDYFADLNACHEAEKVLTEEQFWRYVIKLRMIIGDEMREKYDERFTVKATARQRAECLGIALNLWQP